MDWQGMRDTGVEPGEKETLAAGRPVISILLQIAQARDDGFKRHHRE